MQDLARTSLTPDERLLLERFALDLRGQLGVGLHAVWLFGSRARGEAPKHEDSDVDLLLLVDDASPEGVRSVYDVFMRAARELGREDLTPWFAIHIHTPAWLEERRAIKSFFIAEVERDRVVIAGSP